MKTRNLNRFSQLKLSLAVTLAWFCSLEANAALNYTASDLSTLTDGAVKSLIQTVAIGANHHPYASASPLGYVIGIDLGVDVTGIKLPSDFQNAMKQATGSDVPAVIAIPKLNLRKGFPAGIDAGMSYVGYQANRVVGVDLQWAFFRGSMTAPGLAVRASQNWLKLFFMNTRTTNFDLIASKRLSYFFDPYIGSGVQMASGDLNVPIGGPQGLSYSIAGHQSTTQPHVFVGLPVRLGFFRVTAEAEYSFAKITTYGAKFSLVF